ncbi:MULTISPECIES: hypothetical protein [unclassified Microcoleus]|uniref:hypothetical protein n=1 Tax=unclassified Microcoleus TaxID=2642155 RepID=UPI001D22D07B|nr:MULTISPECIES: hypothetical protein [unclassified Microcoleus]MCC3416329.1 hypothetical protein [Microcoleus sp. PH2017_02_FOX_O_A]MCC3519263.1 hypothetical protein [Microcoleus sp. PH2017_18_LLB_O_A]
MPTAISVAGIKEISTIRENTQTDLNDRQRPPASASVRPRPSLRVREPKSQYKPAGSRRFHGEAARRVQTFNR